MKLSNDVCRCWYTRCEKAETCARFQQRTDGSMSTGHIERMCWTERYGSYIKQAAIGSASHD